MALAIQPYTTCDVYRYPNGPPAAPALAGEPSGVSRRSSDTVQQPAAYAARLARGIPMKPVRNRIARHVRIRAGDLVPHELNPRTHSNAQRRALEAPYEEIGFARSLLAYP